MFKQLTNFAYKRTTKEAFGFYFAYLLIIFILGMIFGLVYALITNNGNYQSEVYIGASVALIFVLSLSFAVLNAKGEWRFGYILIALLAGVVGGLAGGFAGLILTAYLTTLEDKKSVQSPAPTA